ncbi:hypothetical protein [Spirillospora sp. NPDC029432]|uniref:hypothetical protein n=1 Tax=Spirillospora sp. NPDC029432 TaxID=3154599 RepID=UPI0034543D55
MTIPIYTTDQIPVAGVGPVEQAWPVWVVVGDIGKGLDQLAYVATSRGAHAIVGLRVSAFSVGSHGLDQYVLFGTAVAIRTGGD